MQETRAVLFSGGLDSAVLVAHAAQDGPVQPLYVSVGLAWEPAEMQVARRCLASLSPASNIRPLVPLRLEMTDIYPPTHWAVRGKAPAFDTPDEEVYLEGRNIVLLAKAGIFMRRANIRQVLLGILAGNPFPDASRTFFDAFARALSLGLATTLEVETPFASWSKTHVIQMGRDLRVPLELTLSCMQPLKGLHCGRCSKCRERRDAFVSAGGVDPTTYVVQPAR